MRELLYLDGEEEDEEIEREKEKEREKGENEGKTDKVKEIEKEKESEKDKYKLPSQSLGEKKIITTVNTLPLPPQKNKPSVSTSLPVAHVQAPVKADNTLEKKTKSETLDLDSKRPVFLTERDEMLASELLKRGKDSSQGQGEGEVRHGQIDTVVMLKATCIDSLLCFILSFFSLSLFSLPFTLSLSLSLSLTHAASLTHTLTHTIHLSQGFDLDTLIAASSTTYTKALTPTTTPIVAPTNSLLTPAVPESWAITTTLSEAEYEILR